MNLNYPKNLLWLVVIAAIVLWFHYPDTVTLKVVFMSTAILGTPGGFDNLHSGSAHSP